MKPLIPMLLICLGTSTAFAQAARDGVTVSTDPAKAAAVEQHAQELKARAAKQPVQTSSTAKASKTAAKSKSKLKKKVSRAKPTAMK